MLQDLIENRTGNLTSVFEDIKKRLNPAFFEGFTLRGLKIYSKQPNPSNRFNLRDMGIIARSLENVTRTVPDSVSDSVMIDSFTFGDVSDDEYYLVQVGDSYVIEKKEQETVPVEQTYDFLSYDGEDLLAFDSEIAVSATFFTAVSFSGIGIGLAIDDENVLAYNSEDTMVYNHSGEYVINAYCTDTDYIKHDIIDGIKQLYNFLYLEDTSAVFAALKELSDAKKNCLSENTAPRVIRKINRIEVKPWAL